MSSWTTTTDACCKIVRGQAGPKGPTGAVGPTGDVGSTGPTGPTSNEWVPTATSDLNMAGYNISSTGNLTITAPDNLELRTSGTNSSVLMCAGINDNAGINAFSSVRFDTIPVSNIERVTTTLYGGTGTSSAELTLLKEANNIYCELNNSVSGTPNENATIIAPNFRLSSGLGGFLRFSDNSTLETSNSKTPVSSNVFLNNDPEYPDLQNIAGSLTYNLYSNSFTNILYWTTGNQIYQNYGATIPAGSNLNFSSLFGLIPIPSSDYAGPALLRGVANQTSLGVARLETIAGLTTITLSFVTAYDILFNGSVSVGSGIGTMTYISG